MKSKYSKWQLRTLKALCILFGIVLTVVSVMIASLAVTVFHVELELKHVAIIVLVASMFGTFLTAMLLESLE